MSKEKKFSLAASPKYKNFVIDRDRALEVFHTKAQSQINDTMRAFFSQCMLVVSHAFHEVTPVSVRHVVAAVDRGILQASIPAALHIQSVIMRLRKNTYVMSYGTEMEAMARADRELDAPFKVSVEGLKDYISKDSVAGGELPVRLQYVFDKLRRELVNAFQLSCTLKDDHAKMMARVKRALPSSRIVKKPKRVLKKPIMKEAEKPDLGDDQNFGVVTGFVDDETWQDVVSDYQDDFVPKFRGPDDVLDIKTIAKAGENDEWYAWELEQDVTNEFVQSVRDGQIDAASENGIEDFQWIAVIDDRTDDCCLWRDGLSTKEIETLLAGGQDDDCDATVPPAHFNCRCTIAPLLDTQPEPPDSNAADFDEWLKDTTIQTS